MPSKRDDSAGGGVLPLELHERHTGFSSNELEDASLVLSLIASPLLFLLRETIPFIHSHYLHILFHFR